jgi:hypothetical protein
LTFDKRLIWSKQQSSEKESSGDAGSAGISPEQKNGLSIRNGVLLYMQLIRPMIDYA